ncbi:hypothetical protein [Methyloraptor flagellatus]|jgi:hypothetical protein|uniref:Uncharacterized protein n=1 Tax=Methyloraptor flagellatus TaxID=3162530 RepID=A0AAU7XDS5_9HYPH
MSRRLAAPILAGSALLASFLGTVAPATAGIVEQAVLAMPSAAALPSCDDAAVLDTIRDRFSYADMNVNHRGESLGAVEKVRQIRLWAFDRNSPTVRRYCQAHALLNNGKHPQLYYLIENNYGFAGVSWNVEFCLAGREPWRQHDGTCRTVRKWW